MHTSHNCLNIGKARTILEGGQTVLSNDGVDLPLRTGNPLGIKYASENEGVQ
jgi:hypothetical protein